MSVDYSEDEPSVIIEPVERRDAVRGPIPGMTATLPGAAQPADVLADVPADVPAEVSAEVPAEVPAEVVEAGIRGMFVATRALDAFAVGQRFHTVVARGEHSLTCTVEVVRKEQGRRHGIALRVVEISAEAEAIFEAMRA